MAFEKTLGFEAAADPRFENARASPTTSDVAVARSRPRALIKKALIKKALIKKAPTSRGAFTSAEGRGGEADGEARTLREERPNARVAGGAAVRPRLAAGEDAERDVA